MHIKYYIMELIGFLVEDFEKILTMVFDLTKAFELF